MKRKRILQLLITLISMHFSTYLSSQSIIVDDLLDDGEYLWISSSTGLIKYQKQNTATILYTEQDNGIPPVLTNLSKDEEGNIWGISPFHGIIKFNGKQCSFYNKDNSELRDNTVCNHLYIGKNGDIWAGLIGGTDLVQFDGTIWKRYNLTSTYIYAFLNTIYIDKDQTLWLGGFCEEKDVKGTWSLAKLPLSNITKGITPVNISSIGIKDIEIDKQGIFWIICENSFSLESYNPTNGESLVFKLPESDYPNVDSNNQIIMFSDIAIDKYNNKWLCTYQKIYKYDGNNFITYTHSKIDGSVHCLSSDSNGDIWIGTDSGLFKYIAQDKIEPVELNLNK